MNDNEKLIEEASDAGRASAALLRRSEVTEPSAERDGVKGLALDLLDEMNAASSIHYSDYEQLHNLISDLDDPGVIAHSRVDCPDCGGHGATYEQVRVGQHATPFVCKRCDGDGDVPEPQSEPSDAEADAAQRGYHAFTFGPEEVDVFLTPERLAKGRAAWKAALRAAGGAR